LIVAGLLVAWAAAPAITLLDGRRPWVGRTAVGALVLAFAAVATLTGIVLVEGERTMVAGGWAPGVGIVLRADPLGALFATLSLGVLAVALAWEVARGVSSPRLPGFVLFLAAGLTGLFLTGDVFNFYVFFEVAMVASYVLATYGGEARQLGAGFVFAVVNLLGSFLFLIGIAGLYNLTGTLEMSQIVVQLEQIESGASLVVAVVIFVALGVKLGLFPFHFWLPAVYTSASPGVAAMLSGALANIGSYGVLRFGGEVLAAELRAGATVVLILGTASILYGAFQALSRRTASEVLAYSAIGQVGYILVAVALGGPVGYGAAVLYSFVNSLNKGLLFLVTELRGWVVAAAFAIGALSVAGLPPSAGFLGKLALFQTGVETDSVAIVALLFVGGALSFVYMFQIYQHDFWRGERPSERGPTTARALAAGLAVLILALGLWPEPLLAASREAASVLPDAGP
jgi:multicomponent Na+:H+ antiporter subunit D